MHRSPGGVTARPHFLPVVLRPISGCRALRPRPYTPAMRRWVCIVALLAGFSGDDYVRGVRLRQPVADRAPDRPTRRSARPRGLGADGGVVDAPDLT